MGQLVNDSVNFPGANSPWTIDEKLNRNVAVKAPSTMPNQGRIW